MIQDVHYSVPKQLAHDYLECTRCRLAKAFQVEGTPALFVHLAEWACSNKASVWMPSRICGIDAGQCGGSQPNLVRKASVRRLVSDAQNSVFEKTEGSSRPNQTSVNPCGAPG